MEIPKMRQVTPKEMEEIEKEIAKSIGKCGTPKLRRKLKESQKQS